MSSRKGGARVSSSSSSSTTISDSVKNMIENIREITSANDDEIYDTLKECSMDPNETVQRLLTQESFQEVKRKRDKKKENFSNKETVESRLKLGQGRGARGGRGNYSPRYVPNDTKSSSAGKENNTNQVTEKSTGVLLPAAKDLKPNAPTPAISITRIVANGPSAIIAKGVSAKSATAAPHEHPNNTKESLERNNSSAAETQVTSPGAQISSSDPVLVPSQDSRVPGAAGTIRRSVFPSDGKTNADAEVGVVENQQPDAILRPSSAHGGSTVRPSSNHSSRSHQVVGPKVGSKEWKPKSANPDLVQGSSVNIQAHIVTGDQSLEESSTKIQKKLEELHVSNSQQVIIPHYLHVPGAEKVSFCFGSFDAISLDTGFKNTASDYSNPPPPLETSENVEEREELASSPEKILPATEEGNYHPQSPKGDTKCASPGQQELSSAGNQECVETKTEHDLPQRGYQYPINYTSPNYGFGLMPAMMGNNLPPFEGSESQSRDVSRVPSFVVPQQFDPASYYAQIHRSNADGDGRISPFHATAGVGTKYSGGVGVLPPQTSQSVSEGGNPPIVMSTAGPNIFVTQPATGLIPSSIPVTQQPVQIFRQPYGIPIPHYPHNYMPYGPYFAPYFVPPFHQSLTNGAYPHQPQTGSVYQVPPGQSPKFSLPQYKDGNTSANSTSVGVASSYGPAAGNSANNEELTAQQFKESNVYIAGQQSEASAAWLTQPGRDIPGGQANSFYHIPSHGQVPFSHHQPGLGPFTGIYHTAQAVSSANGHPLLQQSQAMGPVADMAGPAPNVYQPPQHAQVAWPNNNY